MIKVFMLLLILLISNAAIAANKQFLVPGGGFLDQKTDDEQWLLPGSGFIDEEAGTPPPVGDRRIIRISKKEEDIEINIDDSNGVLIAKQYSLSSDSYK